MSDTTSATTGTRPAPEGSSLSRGGSARDPGDVTKALVDDLQLLVKKHVELAKYEIVEAVLARVMGVASFIVAGVMSLFLLGFLASAGAFGLAEVMPAWLARLVIAGVFLLIVVVALLFGRARMKRPPMTPEATIETLKEDKEWARTQLGR